MNKGVLLAGSWGCRSMAFLLSGNSLFVVTIIGNKKWWFVKINRRYSALQKWLLASCAGLAAERLLERSVSLYVPRRKMSMKEHLMEECDWGSEDSSQVSCSLTWLLTGHQWSPHPLTWPVASRVLPCQGWPLLLCLWETLLAGVVALFPIALVLWPSKGQAWLYCFVKPGELKSYTR